MKESDIQMLNQQYQEYTQYGEGFLQRFVVECALPLALSEGCVAVDEPHADLQCTMTCFNRIAELGFPINLVDNTNPETPPSYFLCTFFPTLQLLLMIEYMVSRNYIIDCEVIKITHGDIMKLPPTFFRNDNSMDEGRTSVDDYYWRY